MVYENQQLSTRIILFFIHFVTEYYNLVKDINLMPWTLLEFLHGFFFSSYSKIIFDKLQYSMRHIQFFLCKQDLDTNGGNK